MFIQNVSSEIQTSVETYLYGIGKINVAVGEIFQTDDSQGIWLATAYKSIFHIVGVFGGGGGEANTMSNLGLGEGIFVSKVGVDLQIRSLIAGTGVTLTSTATDITIDCDGADNTMTNLGAGAGVYASKVGVQFQMKSFIAGTGVTIVSTANDITINSTGEANDMLNLGVGEGIYSSKVGIQFRMKSLIAGTNISLSSTADEITINSTGGSGETNTMTNLGVGEGVYASKIGVQFQMKSFIAGTGVSLTSTANEITINSSGEANTMLNLGAGEGIYSSKVGIQFRMKSLIAGTNISFSSTADEITINATGAAGEINTASNLGAGEGVYSSKVGVDLRFKSLIAGTNVSFSSTADEITINATSSGETNTASNLAGDEGLFASKVGVDLRFKSITAGTGIVLTSTANDVTISAPAGGVDGAMGSKRATLAFNTASPLNIGTQVPANAIITKIMVNVSTAFNGTANIEFGDSGDTNRLVDSSELDLSTVGLYVLDTYHLYAALTQVIGTYTQGGATVGSADILIEYSTI